MNKASLAPFALGLVVGAAAAAVGLRWAGTGRPDAPPVGEPTAGPESPDSARRPPDAPPFAPARPVETLPASGASASSAPDAPSVPASLPAPAEGPSAEAPRKAKAGETAPGGASASVADLKAAARAALDARDGRRAQDLILQLAQAGPEGRAEALAFLTELAKASEGGGGGRGRGSSLWRILSEPEALPLILEALDKPDLDPALKSRMAWSLDRHENPEAARFALRKLNEEQDPRLLSAYIDALAGREDPDVRSALSSLALSPLCPPDIRRDALGALADLRDPAVDAVLDQIARLDADPQVRLQASVALIERHPPAPGILIQSVTPNTQAQAVGLQPGDIIVEFNGQPSASMDAFRGALQSVPAETLVPIRIRRGAQDLTLQVRGRFLGINGQAVAPR